MNRNSINSINRIGHEAPARTVRRAVRRNLRRATVGLALAAGILGGGASASAAGGLTTPTPTPPPPSDGRLVAADTDPQPSTTCEGNRSCGTLRSVCELVGGTYSGWQSTLPGHGHEHGVCTWPWE